jgi:hypothetical protein
MRDYLSVSTLWKALILGGIVTAMAIPRFLEGAVDIHFYIPASVAAMTLTSGAVVAWGRKGGMCGIWPGTRQGSAGLGLALLLALLATSVYLLGFDPVCRKALEATGNAQMLRLRYPPTLRGRVALVLWSAGFETVFFRASAMSFLARLTGRTSVAVAGSVTLHVMVAAAQLSRAGIYEPLPYTLFLVGTAAAGAIGCLLFARAGLPAAMLFAGALNVHVFFLSH